MKTQHNLTRKQQELIENFGRATGEFWLKYGPKIMKTGLWIMLILLLLICALSIALTYIAFNSELVVP